jgi:hypothetical protein
MTKTAQQIAALHFQSPECQQWLFDPATPLAELHRFIHLNAFKDYGGHGRTIFELSRTVLDVRMSEDAAKSAEKLTGQTDRLISSVSKLIDVAEEQKKLAIKLERQTNKLILLSWVLAIVSAVLLAVALVQTNIMFNENAQTHVQAIQSGQSKQPPGTNN